MEELLRKILAAQLAQLSLLQTIAANLSMQTRAELGTDSDKHAQWKDAKRAIEAAMDHLP